MSVIKISIIVPVYNSEQYLPACLNSIHNQTYKGFEVILIDDGSTDRSGYICDEYAAMDDRFQVYHILNGGVSHARNLGIEKAVGEFVTFVDSDDVILSDFLQNLSVVAVQDVDFVQSGLVFFDEQHAYLTSETLPNQEFYLDANRLDAFELVKTKLITSPCCKLYKRQLIIMNRIQFDLNLSYGEDRDFNLHYIQYVHHAVAMSYEGYCYRKGIATSLSQDKDYEKLLRIDLGYWKKLYSYLQKRSCLTEAEPYLANRLYHFYNDRFSQIFEAKKMSFRLVYDYLKKESSTELFKWLYQHIHRVQAISLMYYSYRMHCPLITAFLYCKKRL